MQSFVTRHRPRLTLLLAFATVWLWIFLAAILNESQLGDSLEQFIWAQSFEWGYWKHPPLSTWLMYWAIHLIGPSHLWPYLLNAALYAITLYSTFKIAELLFNADIASLTVLLLTLHYGFTRRAQLYNHNSVLVCFIALTVLVTLLALRDDKFGQWALAGLLAGLSLLVKYQAILPLVGILVAIGLNNDFQKRAKGIFVAISVAFVTFSPHLYWVYETNFLPFSYGSNYLHHLDFEDRTERQLAFFFTQFRYYLPLIFFILLLQVFSFAKLTKHHGSRIYFNRRQRAWLIGLLGTPLILILFISFASGANLQGQWGMQSTQFLVLLVAPWLFHKFGSFTRGHLIVWGGVQLVALFIFVLQGTGVFLYNTHRSAIRELPAKLFVKEAYTFWTSHTDCPLLYLSGSSALSSIISAYSDQKIFVLEDSDFRKTPWIDNTQLIHHGYLEVSSSQTAVIDKDTKSVPYNVVSHESAYADSNLFLVMKFHGPTLDCKH